MPCSSWAPCTITDDELRHPARSFECLGVAVKRKARLLASVAFGLAAATLTFWYTSAVRDEAEAVRREAMVSYGGDVVRVCVATRDIEPGEAIDDSNVAVEDWVSTLLPAGAATSVKEVTGQTAISRIPKRAVISPVYFEAKKSSLEVPDGKVAVSVASDAEHALGGTLERGDTVDVYISKDSISNRLASAQVLDTSALETNGGEVAWVTLAVDPERVNELLAAASRGMVTLAVSNATDAGEATGDVEKTAGEEGGSNADTAETSEDTDANAGEDALTDGQTEEEKSDAS